MKNRAIIKSSVSRYQYSIGITQRFLFWLGFRSFFDKPLVDLMQVDILHSGEGDIDDHMILDILRPCDSSKLSPPAQHEVEKLRHIYGVTAIDNNHRDLRKIRALAELALWDLRAQKWFISRWLWPEDENIRLLTAIIEKIDAFITN